MTEDQAPLHYRGSEKHKNRPTGERKGTLCPEWTHSTAKTGYGNDPFAHPWKDTEAQSMFQTATQIERRRYATAQGIAFEAKPTGDGTWHGYPIPWEDVPTQIVKGWVEAGKITQRQIKKQMKAGLASQASTTWALSTD